MGTMMDGGIDSNEPDGTGGGDNPRRWRERPWAALFLQAGVMMLPILVASGVGVALVRIFPPAVTGSVLLTWVIAGAAAMLTVRLMQPLYRRLMPLAWLLRVGMLFPGAAPSRYKIARSAGRIRDLEKQLEEARQHGIDGSPQHAAEKVLALVTALTNHDRRTRGHAERTRVFTDLLSAEMGLPEADRDRLRWSSLLHDIGKLEVPEKILNKASKPSKYEWEVLKRHPIAGDRIIEPLRDWLGEWADATLHHHEKWDGTGYPNGLSGVEISLAGRVVSVADCYEVMTASRAYKRPMSAISAREELVRCSGTQFDPAIVRAFLLIPLSRLRWALGPFAWFAQLPIARVAVHHGHQAVARVPEAVAMGEVAAVSAAALSVGAATSASATEVEFPDVVAEQSAEDAQAFDKTPIAKPDPVADKAVPPPSSSSGSSDEATTKVLGQTQDMNARDPGDQSSNTGSSNTDGPTEATVVRESHNDEKTGSNEPQKQESTSGTQEQKKQEDSSGSSSDDEKSDDSSGGDEKSGGSSGGDEKSGGSSGSNDEDEKSKGKGQKGPPSHARDKIPDKAKEKNPHFN